MTQGKPGRIPDLVVQDLISRTDIGTLIGESVQLKRAGQNLSGLCPFHDEKSPSFTVSPIKNFYYCFGCAASGNAISFMMDYHHLSFVNACESLAQRLGINIQYEQNSGYTPKKIEPELNDALTIAKDFFKTELQKLPQHHPVQKYLKNRTISQQSIDHFEIGYAPSGWESLKDHLKTQHVTESHALETGLLTQGKSGKIYDRFRARIIFPIKDIKGQTIAFGGRVLGDEQPKYLNSPESPVFQKREALFGLPDIIKAGKLDKVMITEGYLDVVRMHQVDLRYAVAALGTATSEQHIKILFRLSDHIIACFDADNAGEKAAWRFLEHSLSAIQSHQRIDFLFLPAGQDPDSFIAEYGKNAFLVEEQKTQGLSEFFIGKLTADLQLHQLDDRAKLLKRALPLVDKIKRSVLRELLLQQLSELSRLPLERVETAMSQMNQKQPATPKSQAPVQQKQQYKHQRLGQYETHQSNQPYKKQGQYKKGYQKQRYGQDKFTPPAPLPKSENLIDAMLRLLLQQPKLAQKHELHLEAEPIIAGFQIFHETYQQLRANPEASLAYLMGLWHELPKGEHLSTLAAEEFLVPSTTLDLEFADGLYQLESIALNAALAQAAKARPLDKTLLQQLLQKKQKREQEKSISADVHTS